MDKPVFAWRMLAPKYWPTWLAFGFWWLLAQLPVASQMSLGAMLGRLLPSIAKRRAQIVKRNLELCFPGLSEDELKRLYRQCLSSIGKGFFEIGLGWFASPSRLKKRVTISGVEHLQKVLEQGQGVLMLGIHYTTIDLCGSVLCMNFPIDGSYRTHKNPVYDYIQRSRRERHNNTLAIARGDIRAMIRSLKKGRICWYAPDQDYGPKSSVFAPFFDIPAATITGTSKLAKLGNAVVIPYTFNRIDSRGYYQLTIKPPIDNFPTGNDVVDATLINQFVEASIAPFPDQYLWAHRRFKTRPEGERDLYTTVGISRGRRDPGR